MNNKLKLDEVYISEARRIFEAKKEAKIIHNSGDIVSSGDQTERAVRRFIGNRLPTRFRTTHGHVVDYCGRASPQFDIIISESLSSKSLFEAADGTEYIPYESVYAIGEIKSSFDKSKKPIESFSKSIEKLKTHLSRQKHVKHKILTFLVFVTTEHMDYDYLEATTKSIDRPHYPSFMCFLDRGSFTYTRMSKSPQGSIIPLQYFLSDSDIAPADEKHMWSIIHWGDSDNRSGVNLMFLHLSIVQHLQTCPAGIPNLTAYMIGAMSHESGIAFQ
ncbi:hypothetical protein SAMN04487957_101329 [Halomonas shengliensis]|uniref:DUF6602 domain-containing protein n=1 Tax=Halomonas shengliensis TaxID=419597 RepID=A0A1H0DA83_9GAMM|nr:DUF6602 domain-containing protein [Halomonas shengliensis]SDN67025.1 hypothetical protein SAMN04487957_101329 [Halomonas shengliensis]